MQTFNVNTKLLKAMRAVISEENLDSVDLIAFEVGAAFASAVGWDSSINRDQLKTVFESHVKAAFLDGAGTQLV